MDSKQYVTMDLVNGSQNEYIVKDNLGITIGRTYILELSKENRMCLARVRFYKDDKEAYLYLKYTIKLLLKVLLKNMNMYKVNIIVDEDLDIKAFIDTNFSVEGILTYNISQGKDRKNEILLGINKWDYESSVSERVLELKGPRIKLRILTPENAADIFEYYTRNKEYLKPFEPSRDESFFSLEVQRDILAESFKQYLNGNNASFGIFKDDYLIGKISVSNIILGVFRSAFVGYSIDKEEQNKGYMKEALNLVTLYCFNELGLHRLEASTLVDNIKSQRVLKSCGFNELGINKNYLYINGEWKDHLAFYKINE